MLSRSQVYAGRIPGQQNVVDAGKRRYIRRAPMSPEEIQAEIDAAVLEVMDVSDIRFADKNPRVNAEAAERLADTVREVGWGAPPLIQRSSGKLIAGDTRLRAARAIGLKRLPVLVLDVDDRRAKALQLADNRIAEIAQWDYVGLAEELEEFSPAELTALGFDTDYLHDLETKIPDFNPSDGVPRLDEKGGGWNKTVACPKCGHEFDIRPGGE